jgi:hypothetical protein
MGVTIHYALGMQSGRVKTALDRAQSLAEEIKREQAATLGVPVAIRRLRATSLSIDIGECETLAFDFNTFKGFQKTGENGEPAWSYERSVLGRYFAPQVLVANDDEHYKRWPEQRPMWASAFCKTQFAKSLAEHRWVAELIRSVASVAEYAHVYDEGHYYHTLDIEHAATTIYQNGLLINALGGKLRVAMGDGLQVVPGGETTIKPLRKHAAGNQANYQTHNLIL